TMKAKEVVAKYAEGERDFRRVDLRGQSFKGENLAGADFRGADIRGTNFTKANLTGVDFQEAKAGLPRRWMVVQMLFSLALAAISGFCSILVGAFVTFIFDSSDLEYQIAGWLTLAILVIFSIIILRQGTNVALSAGAFVGAVAVAGIFAGTFTFTVAVAGLVGVTGLFATAVAVTLMVTLAVEFTGALALAVAFTVVGTDVGAVVLAVALVFTGAVALVSTGALALVSTGVLVTTLAVVVTGALIILSAYIGWQTIKGNEKYTLIKTIAVALAATGGTSFRQANLTEAEFHKATLKNTDFRKATLTRTYWKDSLKLDFARLGNTYLSHKAIRELIFTNNGYKKSYQGLNLRGVNLAGVNLEAANLKQADLAEANLRQANLKDANLTEINAVATDFTNATLTGACLEAWNIDHTTKLKDIDCQYIYLLEKPNNRGNRERRPHNSDAVFQPGDFSQLFQEVLNVVQLLIRDGLNPEAFQQAFQKIMQQHPGITPDSIQEIKKKGKDVVVTLEVPEETDKGVLEKDFHEVYQLRLEVATKDVLLQEMRDDKKQLFGLLSDKNKQPIINKITNTAKSNAMNENNQDSRQLNIGDVAGDFKPMGSALNAGDVTISGTVAETINQLPPSPDAEKPGIKELLSQLAIAIEAENNLNEEEKQEALEEIQNLAKAGQNPQAGNKKKLAKKAMTMLKGIAAGVPAAAGLAKAVKELLPMIGSIFGF
ncbi:MAG: pentapeptide repeat-containing protein, partial [Spirulinaceae cyanobacterium]